MLDYWIIGIYLAAVTGIGFLFSSGAKNAENYLLGGRNMPGWAIGISCMMSLLSSITIVMVPGEIYNNGATLFSVSLTAGLILQIPAYLIFTRFYFKLGSFTPYEYLEYRYDNSVRTAVAVCAFYTRTMYIGMVLYTTSKIFEGAYNWPAWVTILTVGVFGVLYTVMGGMKAVVWTDVLQFFFLFGGLGIVVWVLCSSIHGGAVEAVRCAAEQGHFLPQYSQPEFYSLSPYVRLLFWLMFLNAFLTPLTTACSDQINIQRLLSTKDWKTGFRSQILSSVLGLCSSLLLIFIGLALFTYYRQNPDPTITGGDTAFFHFVTRKLPTPIPGLFMAAMLAAVMSTLDSGINSMATVYLKEFHIRFFEKQMSPAREVTVSRYATFGIGLFSVLLGLAIDVSGRWLEQSVAEVGTLFYIIGAAILPAFLFAVLSKKASSALIWAYTAFSLGEGLASNFWYAASRASLQQFEKDPSCGFGWAGKLPLIWALLPLIGAVIFCLPYCRRTIRQRWSVRISVLVGLLLAGGALQMFVWYFYSNALITDHPEARSFGFFLPIGLLLAFIILPFLPEQPKEKYQGLTLSTLGEEIPKRK